MDKIPFSNAVTTLEKSNPHFASAVKFIMGKDSLEKELAEAFIALYKKHMDLSMDYTSLYREANRLYDENEFMIKTVNEECNK